MALRDKSGSSGMWSDEMKNGSDEGDIWCFFSSFLFILSFFSDLFLFVLSFFSDLFLFILSKYCIFARRCTVFLQRLE